MSLLSWFDNRTLFGCQCMLSVMFAVLFLWMGRAFPTVRGVQSFAWAFLLGIPCTFLMLSRGHIADILSITLGNVLAMVCFLLLYDGIVRFIGGRSRIRLLAGLAVIPIGVVVYYSDVETNIVPRIIAMELVAALIRGLMAWELLRQASAPPGTLGRVSERGGSGRRIYPDASRKVNRSAMRFFGIFLGVLAGFGLIRSVMTAVLGAPNNFMQRDSIQTSMMLFGVAFIGVSGLCFLTMAGHELILHSQEESERDLVSGVFNRRGIEARLATELKRSKRSQHRLSVALVDIDHFKSINDRHGHATGDAAIREVSEAIATSLRDGDFLGRYGGDEFLIVLPMTACEDAVVAAERLSRAVHDLEQEGGQRLTLSIGLTEACLEDDAISLIARADEALYQAKSDGRNCLRTVTPMSRDPRVAQMHADELPAGAKS